MRVLYMSDEFRNIISRVAKTSDEDWGYIGFIKGLGSDEKIINHPSNEGEK